MRSKCAGASVDELKRLKELEAENVKAGHRWEPQTCAPGLLRPASQPAAAGEAPRPGAPSPTAGGAGAAQRNVGAQLHDRCSLRRPPLSHLQRDRRGQSGGARDRDRDVDSECAGHSGPRRSHPAVRPPVPRARRQRARAHGRGFRGVGHGPPHRDRVHAAGQAVPCLHHGPGVALQQLQFIALHSR